jgi:hypothetical protein
MTSSKQTLRQEGGKIYENCFYTPAPRRGRGYTVLPLSVLPDKGDNTNKYIGSVLKICFFF